MSGRATVAGMTVNVQPWLPGFDLEPPYAIAVVALEEDRSVRLTTNVTGLIASTGVCLSNLSSLTSAVKPLTDIASSLVQLPGNLSSLEVRPGAGARAQGQ